MQLCGICCWELVGLGLYLSAPQVCGSDKPWAAYTSSQGRQKCYYFADTPIQSWHSANTECQSYGGTLVTIATLDEQLFIVEYVSMLSYIFHNNPRHSQAMCGKLIKKIEWKQNNCKVINNNICPDNRNSTLYSHFASLKLWQAHKLGVSDIWIGLVQDGMDGPFVWVDESTPLTFENFMGGQPNNNNGHELCVEMLSASGRIHYSM